MFEQQKVLKAAEALTEAFHAYLDAVNSRHRDTSFNSMRRDRRYLRTQRLVAEIMQIVGPHLCEHGEHHGARNVHRQLFDTFYDAGVEVLTDQDRAEIGLPPRDTLGWTRKEVIAHDNRMREAMLSPVPTIIPAP